MIKIITRTSSTKLVHNASSLKFFDMAFSSPFTNNAIKAPINGVIIIDDNIGNETKINLLRVHKN